MAVPIPNRLFSTTYTTGSFQSAAMFSDSWNAPMFTAASPKKTSVTWSRCRYFVANATPVASGIWPPTIAWPPSSPCSRSKRCIEPPLPFEMPSRRPKSSAITRPGSVPFTSACTCSR